jgi:DNA polymerase
MRFGDRVWEGVLWCMENPGEPREVGLMTLVYDPAYLKGTLFAVMPNGDPLLYTGIAWREVVSKDKTSGEEKTETRLTVRKGRGTMPIWVGEFINNFVQGIEAALLRQVLCKLESEGLQVVLHVHDDICVEVDAGRAKWAEEKMMEIMCSGSDWTAGLPIAAEPTTWDWYTKTLG